jgi:putative acetyltransferase
MAVIFRKIRKEDNKEIASLIRTVFREFHIDKPGTVYFDPTTDDLYSLFQTPGSVYWIAEEEEKITGGCGIFPTPGLPEGCAELVKFYLMAEKRGKGTGWKLMEKSFDSARELGYTQLYLETLPELNRAISLYKNAGFRSIPSQLGNSGHFGCTIWMIKNL